MKKGEKKGINKKNRGKKPVVQAVGKLKRSRRQESLVREEVEKNVIKNWRKTLNEGITSQVLAICGFIRGTALHNNIPEKRHNPHF